jgi:hypothetical protein
VTTTILTFPKIHYQHNIFLIQTLQDDWTHIQQTLHSFSAKLWKAFSLHNDMPRPVWWKVQLFPFCGQVLSSIEVILERMYPLHSLCSNGRHERALSCGELGNMRQQWSWPISSYCTWNNVEGVEPPPPPQNSKCPGRYSDIVSPTHTHTNRT